MKERPELSPATRQWVEAVFNQDLQILGSWLGVDLDCQSFKKQVLALEEVRWSR
jgi:hypothetical protein